MGRILPFTCCPVSIQKSMGNPGWDWLCWTGILTGPGSEAPATPLFLGYPESHHSLLCSFYRVSPRPLNNRVDPEVCPAVLYNSPPSDHSRDRSPPSWPKDHSLLVLKVLLLNICLEASIPREDQEAVTSNILCPSSVQMPGGLN